MALSKLYIKVFHQGVDMITVCFDMEGVLRLEDWIAVVDKVGIPDFGRTAPQIEPSQGAGVL